MENYDVIKLYSDIVFELESLKCFVKADTLDRRKYIHFLNIVQECAQDPGKIKFQRNADILRELINCQKCKCFKCTEECIAGGCNRCEPGGLIVKCDNEISTVYNFSNKIFSLISNKLRSIANYKVLAIIEDIKYKQFFIVLLLDEKKYVAYYYPEVGGDTFSEIKAVEDFNFAIEIFEDSEVI